ncbi:MAG: hypothetical protein IPH93_06750 [Saprospiraceae bacterium]|nr:hypothetical protein [Saprospiraceae bacterium]
MSKQGGPINFFVVIIFHICLMSCKDIDSSSKGIKLFNKISPDESGIHFNNVITETP